METEKYKKEQIRIIFDQLLMDGHTIEYFNGCTQNRIDGLIDVYTPSGRIFNIKTREWSSTEISWLKNEILKELEKCNFQ